jgi:hypothetical protein
MKKIFFGLMVVAATTMVAASSAHATDVLVTPKQTTAVCPSLLVARRFWEAFRAHDKVDQNKLLEDMNNLSEELDCWPIRPSDGLFVIKEQREGYCEITKPYSREIKPWTPDISDLPNKWVVCFHLQLQ